MAGTSHRAAASGERIFPDSAMLSAQPQWVGYPRRAVNHQFGTLQQFRFQAGWAECLRLGALVAEPRAVAVDGLRHANRELFERMRRDEEKHFRELSRKLKMPGTGGIGGA